jgi:2-polyprenyl-3-methyl-5-hydroxy-6-metoxy-1,4-benzoquinol methylase
MTTAAFYDKLPIYSSVSPSSLLKRAHIDVRDKVVLDLGCGDGRVCLDLLQRGARFCQGADYSKVRIRVAQDTATEKQLSARCDFGAVDVGEYVAAVTAAQLQVDLVCLFELLHLLDDPAQFLEQVKPIAKAVIGSVPLQGQADNHVQHYQTVDEVVQLVGASAVYTVVDSMLFFYCVY